MLLEHKRYMLMEQCVFKYAPGALTLNVTPDHSRSKLLLEHNLGLKSHRMLMEHNLWPKSQSYLAQHESLVQSNALVTIAHLDLQEQASVVTRLMFKLYFLTMKVIILYKEIIMSFDLGR